MNIGSIGSWLDDDTGSLWMVQSVTGQTLTIQQVITGEVQTIQTEDFWLLVESL